MMNELYASIQEWLKLAGDKVIDRRVNELIDAMTNMRLLIKSFENGAPINVHVLQILRNKVVNIILDLFMLLHSVDQMDDGVIIKMMEAIKSDIDESR